MAYGQQNKPAYGSKTQAVNPVATAGQPAVGTAKPAIFRTGLFAPNREGVKSIGSVQVKEDVTIPAGSFINLYTNDKRTGDTSPMFNLTVTAGTKKQ